MMRLALCDMLRRTAAPFLVLLQMLLLVFGTGRAKGLGATQAYRLTQASGACWLQAPDGSLFWSFGVCCVNPGQSRTEYDPSNPGYASFRLYPTPDSWAQDTVERLRRWGFNTLGGWSDAQLLNRSGAGRPLPYFVVLHLGAWCNAPWSDLFDSQTAGQIDLAARRQIPALRDDPNLIGYFSDNELGWWPDTLLHIYFEMPPRSAGKQALLRVIRSCYRNDFRAFRRDWNTSARSWSELSETRSLLIRSGGGGASLIHQWAFALADRYYALVSAAIRRYDSARPQFGDRFAQYYALPVARAAAMHLEAISTNLGADWNDGTLTRFYLDTLFRVTRKPVVIGEFYMCSKENRSGNRNSGTAFPVVDTQRDRAHAFRNNVMELASRPYVIGAHWFQFYDEPMHGRKDGEDFNMGLVDIEGRPYTNLTDTAASLDLAHIHSQGTRNRTGAIIPAAPERPLTDLKSWDRRQGFAQPESGPAFADLYVCHDANNLYLGLIAMDFVDDALYGGRIPECERSTMTVRVPGLRMPIVVRYGGKGRSAYCSEEAVAISESPGLKHTVLLRIPFRMRGRRWRPNAASSLQIALVSHSRAQRMRWRIPIPTQFDE